MGDTMFPTHQQRHKEAVPGGEPEKDEKAAVTAMTRYVHRLNGNSAKHKHDPNVRQSSADDGSAIQSDLRSFRSGVGCS
jgi:hypothetical protein